MVSPGRVTAQSIDYYKDKVASGAEEYFSGRGEAEGTWLGSGALKLGLREAKVSQKNFEIVFSGKSPKTLEYLASHFSNKKVLAVDMTFSAPKSVSVLWALSPAKVRAEIEAAHEAAVEHGFAYLESECAWGRQGKGGVRKVPGQGLTAAAYRHRTSRAADPQLHTHVLVANFVEFEDGRYGSLDTAKFWHHAPTLTAIYQRELRKGLTSRLGVDWEATNHGLADIKGFPSELKHLFSKRHQQIVQAAGEFGRDNPWSRQLQTLLTRRTKNVVKHKMFDDWKVEAEAAGFTPSDVLELCNQAQITKTSAPEIAAAIDKLARDEVLTSSSAHFGRRHVLALFAAKLPIDLSDDEITRLADDFIDQRLVTLSPNRDSAASHLTTHQKAGDTPLTTPEMFVIERRAIALVQAGVARSNVRLTDQEIQDGLARHAPPSLGADQRAMIEHILSSGNAVDCVVGDAGTGKTFSFEIAHKILAWHGFKMGGGALAAVAAQELSKKANMDSSTIASLLWRIDNPTPKFIKNLPDILVIDEAAMVGTKSAGKLIDFCHERKIKLIFVGDAKQIPAIEAGGIFSLIDGEIGSARLYENYRQRANAAHVELVNEWRDGHAGVALRLSAQLGQLNIASNESEMLEQMMSDWASDPRRAEAVMIAVRHVEVRALNKAAQRARLKSGEISDDHITTDLYSFHVGDRVRCKARDGDRNVHNGTDGIVVGINRLRKTVSIETADGKRVSLDCEFVADPEKFQLGYALTAASVQGATFRNAYVALSANMNREVAYTANSRATNATYIYATTDNPFESHAGFEPDKVTEQLEYLIRALERSGAQLAASALGEEDDYGNYSTEEIQEAIDEHHELMTRNVVAQYDAALEKSPVDELTEYMFTDPSIVRDWATEHPELSRTFESLLLELSRRVRHDAALASVDPPAWAIAELGPVPQSPISRTYWREGYKHVARHRVRFGLTESERAYGDGPRSLVEKRSTLLAKGQVNDAKSAIRDAGVKIRGAAL
ncbi:MAG: MobF family relaxase [Solirubrobacterales bacterium]